MSLLRKDEALTVLALDPGEKVGWARAVVAPNGEWLELRHGITDLRPMAETLGKVYPEYDVVVYETWRLYPHMAQKLVGSDMKSSQFVGIIRYLSWLHQDTVLVSQGASIQKTATKTAPAWLREITEKGVRHDDGHDISALLHLWHWTWMNYTKELHGKAN